MVVLFRSLSFFVRRGEEGRGQGCVRACVRVNVCARVHVHLGVCVEGGKHRKRARGRSALRETKTANATFSVGKSSLSLFLSFFSFLLSSSLNFPSLFLFSLKRAVSDLCLLCFFS